MRLLSIVVITLILTGCHSAKKAESIPQEASPEPTLNKNLPIRAPGYSAMPPDIVPLNPVEEPTIITTESPS